MAIDVVNPNTWRQLRGRAGTARCALNARRYPDNMTYVFTVSTQFGRQLYHLSYAIPEFRLDDASAEHAVNLLIIAMKGHIANGFTRFESTPEEGMLQAITPCY